MQGSIVFQRVWDTELLLRQWSSCKNMVFVCVIWSFDDMGLGEQVILSDKESKGVMLWKVNHKLVKNFFFISVVKKGNFNRAPLGCFFKIYRYWYTDLLFEVKFDIVGEHLPDDSDKFAGTMPKCIVVRPAFSPLGIIISLEGCVVSDNVPSCIYKGIS